MCDGIKESSGNKEKISKWKLYKNQIKLLKESAKPDIPSKKVYKKSFFDLSPFFVQNEGEVLLDRVSGIDITLSSAEPFQDVHSDKKTKKDEKQ